MDLNIRQQRPWPAAALVAAALLCLGTSGCNHVDAATGQVGFTAWSITAGTLKARIQVRLAPRVHIRTAVLAVSSPHAGIHFQPDRFVLDDLAPPSYPRKKDHNPPALGKTLLRTFLVSASRPGDYAVRIHLRWNGHRETRKLVLHFPEAHTP